MRAGKETETRGERETETEKNRDGNRDRETTTLQSCKIGEFQRIRPVIFRCAPIDRSAIKTPFSDSSLAFRSKLVICDTDLAIGAPHVNGKKQLLKVRTV